MSTRLSHEEFCKVHKRWKRSGNEADVRAMIRSHMGLVHQAARKRQWLIAGSVASYEDLVQAGTVGLWEAIRRFDHGRGTKFSTYAVYWIQANIDRAIATTRHPVHIAIKDSLATPPPITYSLDIENAVEISDGGAQAEAIVNVTHDDARLSRIAAALATIPRREALIVIRRMEGWTLQELAAELGVCRERVRQLEDVAMRKIRNAVAQAQSPTAPTSQVSASVPSEVARPTPPASPRDSIDRPTRYTGTPRARLDKTRSEASSSSGKSTPTRARRSVGVESGTDAPAGAERVGTPSVRIRKRSR